MKKTSFVVVALLLSVGCAHTNQKISKEEARQATVVLQEITTHVQDYHAKNNQWPANHDFTALGMKNPSTKKWKYDFACMQEQSQCDISAQRGKESTEELLMRLRYTASGHVYSHQITTRYKKKSN